MIVLLVRHRAKSLISQEERLATSPQLVTRLHLSHALVVRLHVRKSSVVILTPETADTVGLSSSLSLSTGHSIRDEAMGVARSAPRGAHFHADVIYLLP